MNLDSTLDPNKKGIKQHILLLKLKYLYETAPHFGDTPNLNHNSAQRIWFSKARALLHAINIEHQVKFNNSFNLLVRYWKPSTNSILGQISDAIEELKLALDLEGRSEIGSVYDAGQVYNFFKDLKAILSEAKQSVFIVDPYFSSEAFETYIEPIDKNVDIKILTKQYASEVKKSIELYNKQESTNIELFISDVLHDRVVFVDKAECWVIGGSIKDAGKKPTYLIPIYEPLSASKLKIYEDLLK